MSLLTISKLSHSFGDGPLFHEAELSLNQGEHIGLVGQNGAGKSTLLKLCTEQMTPDAGQIAWHPRITVGYLDQYAQMDPGLTIRAFLTTAFSALYETERRMLACYDRAAQGDEGALLQADKAQQALEAAGFYALETRMEQVSAGLGLCALGLHTSIGALSGGQRAKVILAKLLLAAPDVMLLDEPTNFLDKEHIAWLAAYLAGVEGAFLVISHDTAFLDRIATRIVDIDQGKLMKYYGGYSDFVRKKALLREDYARRYTAQQKEIKQTEEFIRRNIAGRKTNMAKGRRKQLSRLDRLEAPDHREMRPDFHFAALPATETEHLSVKNLSVGYDTPILSGLSFDLKGCQKVVVTGFNGVGKSTLLNTLMGRLTPLGGGFAFSAQVSPAYFAQDLSWADPRLTPMQLLSEACPALSGKELRQRLSRCGIATQHMMQAVATLSGGEQVKVKLCLLQERPCNFLLLDEPTNHLDKLAKEALQEALQAFPGTVLLVSHEEGFYRDWADRIIAIGS